MRISLCIPTRGVIFARTIKCTLLNPELPKDTYSTIVEGLPIPDAHNECIRRSLATDCTHILFVEEDMEIPKGGITEMIRLANEGKQYVCIDYPLLPTLRSCIMRDENGKPIFSGFGCTMFDRKLFDDMKDPWLTQDYDVMIDSMKPFKYHIQERTNKDYKVYGKYDVYFGALMREKGVPITEVPMLCNHLRMRSWERKETNNGAHEIYEI